MQTFDQSPLILWSPPGERAEQDCACADDDLAPDIRCIPVNSHAEHDCACPALGLFPTPPAALGVITHWRRIPHLYHAPLSRHHILAFNPAGHAGVVVLNRPAHRILNAYDTPRTLDQAVAVLPGLTPEQVEGATQQLAHLEMLAPTDAPQPVEANTNHTLTAWLHVTNACNLRCTYCYLDKSGEAMNEFTGRAAVETVFRSAVGHGFRAVKLKYAGGEPLLSFNLVQKLDAHAHCLSSQTGVALREVVLSNGVALSDAVLDWLCENGVRLMISLDGVGAAHDAQRMFSNGHGSFVQVAGSIDRALERGVRPYLSITITAQNVDHLAKAVAFALERDLLFNLNFYRENDLSTSCGDLQIEERRLIAGVLQAFAVIEEQLPQQSLIGALIDRASFGTPHCYPCGAGRNYLVIDQQGYVSRCQMEIEKPVTDVWAGDPMTAVRSVGTGFQNLAVEEKDECRECQWRNWCAGGCPLLTNRASRRNDVKSPYCNVYKALFPEALRLEGLRLLKWGSTLV